MNEQKYYVNADGQTTDITLDITKNDIVTISNKTIMNIAQELQRSGNVEMAFIEGMGIVPTLSSEEDKELTRRAQADRIAKEKSNYEEVLAEQQEHDDKLFDEHKEMGAEDWADKGERDMAERETLEEIKREETL